MTGKYEVVLDVSQMKTNTNMTKNVMEEKPPFECLSVFL